MDRYIIGPVSWFKIQYKLFFNRSVWHKYHFPCSQKQSKMHTISDCVLILETRPRTSHVWSKCSFMKPYPQPFQVYLFWSTSDVFVWSSQYLLIVKHYKENLIPLSHCVSQPVFTNSFPLTSHADLVLKKEMAKLITHVCAHVRACVWRERWCVYKEQLSVCNCYEFF